MIGQGNISFVFLRIAFELQKIIIAAASITGEIAADFRARVVGRAASFIPIKKAAYLAIDLVFMPLHDALVAMGLACEFFPGSLGAHIMGFGQSFDIALGQRNDRV